MSHVYVSHFECVSCAALVSGSCNTRKSPSICDRNRKIKYVKSKHAKKQEKTNVWWKKKKTIMRATLLPEENRSHIAPKLLKTKLPLIGTGYVIELIDASPKKNSCQYVCTLCYKHNTRIRFDEDGLIKHILDYSHKSAYMVSIF
jgi:hypothetical protein